MLVLPLVQSRPIKSKDDERTPLDDMVIESVLVSPFVKPFPTVADTLPNIGVSSFSKCSR